ncbi:MAG: sel1 repeat family protein [Pseudomonadota bacterium]|nr:sel1 repeat family protein [Pseudomonadota bacterium]
MHAVAATPSPYMLGDQTTFALGVAAFDAKDYTRAFAIFSKLADDDDLAARRNMALMERRGLGTEKDPEAAIEDYKVAAEAGLPTAAADLGEMLLDGEAGRPDPKAALPWLLVAAAAHHPVAQFHLGQMYETGAAVPKNRFQAILFYSAAAARGYQPAIDRLGVLEGWAKPGAGPVVDPAP